MYYKGCRNVEKRIFKADSNYNYIVMNDDLEAAVEDVVHIISTIRHRTMLYKELFDQINATFE